MKHLFKKSPVGIFFGFVFIIISFSVLTGHVEAATVSAKADSVNPLTISGPKYVALTAYIDFDSSGCRLYKGTNLTTPVETKTAFYARGSLVTFANEYVTATITYTVKCDVAETYAWSTGTWGACTVISGSCSGSYSGCTNSSGQSQCESICQDTQGNHGVCGFGPPLDIRSCSWVEVSSQTRTVVCKNSSGTTVSDSYCTGTKPATTQSC